jgi:predicted alpha/beta-fold hydrolase
MRDDKKSQPDRQSIFDRVSRYGHFDTLLPFLFKVPPQVRFERERIDTPDGDFLDLDWLKSSRKTDGPKKLVIISHGLEGSSRSKYILSMSKIFSDQGFDILAWNNRSCSGELNRVAQLYHSGFTDDLRLLVDREIELKRFDQIFLVGFSMGGNITLKYLGEESSSITKIVSGAVAISVPCDLASSAVALSRGFGRVYAKRLLRTLSKKIEDKKHHYHGLNLDYRAAHKMWDFQSFDDSFTAKIYGFKDAKDYWDKSSCKASIEKIHVPSLILNAANDPFLAPACFPIEETKRSAFVKLEIPDRGGHVGFVNNEPGQWKYHFGKKSSQKIQPTWCEQRALQFFANI